MFSIMLFYYFCGLLALHMTCISLAHGYDFKRALETSQKLQPRILLAAAHESDIAYRGLTIPVKNDLVLHYIDVICL